MTDDLTTSFSDALDKLREALAIIYGEVIDMGGPWTETEREALDCVSEDIKDAIRWLNWVQGKKAVQVKEETA